MIDNRCYCSIIRQELVTGTEFNETIISHESIIA